MSDRYTENNEAQQLAEARREIGRLRKLLEQAGAALIQHDSDYHFVTPTALAAEIRSALSEQS